MIMSSDPAPKNLLGNKICRLCNKTAKLVKSHIIPKSMYVGLVDQAGKITQEFSGDGRSYPKRRPVGYYDEIMCRECEDKFARWDDHMQKVLNKKNLKPFYNDQGIFQAYTVKNFDYKKCKLFFMSLLWRAHVTSIPFFRSVQLGPFYSKLTQFICDENPGCVNDFTVVLFKFEDQRAAAFLSPTRYQHKEDSVVDFYCFPLPMWSVEIKVDIQPASAICQAFALKPDSEWYIVPRDFQSSQERKLMESIVHKNSQYI